MLKAQAEETSWEFFSTEGKTEVSSWGKGMDLPDCVAEVG